MTPPFSEIMWHPRQLVKIQIARQRVVINKLLLLFARENEPIMIKEIGINNDVIPKICIRKSALYEPK